MTAPSASTPSSTPPNQSPNLILSPRASRPTGITSSPRANRPTGVTSLPRALAGSVYVWQRKPHVPVSYESIVAARSRTRAGRATRSYYGIDIHELVDGARQETEKRGSPRLQGVSPLSPSISRCAPSRIRIIMSDGRRNRSCGPRNTGPAASWIWSETI